MKKLPRYLTSPISDNRVNIDPKFQQKLRKELFMPKTNNNQKSYRKYLSINYLIPAGAVIVLMLIAGAGTYAYSNNRNSQEMLRDLQLPSDLSDLKPIDEIRQIASLELVDGVSITSIELEQEEGVLVYKIKFSNGTYKLYNARSGEMVTKSDLEIDTSVPIDFVAGITIEQARSKAQTLFPDKTITKIELEVEERVVVYSVKFSDDSRVDVSATNGEIIKTRDAQMNDDTEDENDPNEDSDDSVDSEDHAEEDIEDDGDRSGSNSGSNEGQEDN